MIFLVMGLATLCLDFGKSPEPEPGRCRRTDGKKWRCWRNVVPDQKYCERHLHRGRKRPIQVEIIDEPEDAMPLALVGAASASAKKGTSEGGTTTSSKKSKKERVSKDSDTQVAVPTTAAAVKSS
jgi:WRC